MNSAAGGAGVPVRGRDAPPSGLAGMRQLIGSLPAAVAYLSVPDLVIDFANDACLRLVGSRDLAGRPLSEALPELAAQGQVERLARSMETGELVRGGKAEVWIHRLPGRPNGGSSIASISRFVTPEAASRGSCCLPPMSAPTSATSAS